MLFSLTFISRGIIFGIGYLYFIIFLINLNDNPKIYH